MSNEQTFTDETYAQQLETVEPVAEQPVVLTKPDYTPGSLGSPADLAGAFFRKEKPVLKALLANLSAKQLRRVFMNAAAFPFTDAGDVPRTEVEKKAAYIFSEMTMNKCLMILTRELEKVQEAETKAQQAQAAAVREETPVTPSTDGKEEVLNG